MNAPEMLQAAPFAGDVQRRRNAEIILREFEAARWPAGMALAAIVNAVAESNLNEFAAGDGGHSVGLFQINDLGGKVIYPFDRTDPRANTRHILQELANKWNKTGKIGRYNATESMAQAFSRGGTVPKMAALFAAIVERPADIPGEMAKREALARTLFPEVAIRRADTIAYRTLDFLVPARTDVEPMKAAYWWASMLGAASIVVAVIVRQRRKRSTRR
jgi:hypothetical protein